MFEWETLLHNSILAHFTYVSHFKLKVSAELTKMCKVFDLAGFEPMYRCDPHLGPACALYQVGREATPKDI